jgi:hypothetical protein
MEVLEGPNPHLLHDVFRTGVVAHDRPGHAVEALVVAA